MAAIYQWFPTGQLMFLTTTPYPIEALDSFDFSVTLDLGGMYLIPNEGFDSTMTMMSMDLRQILKTTGPYYEAFDSTMTMMSMDLKQILKTTGPYYEAFDSTMTFLSMDLVAKLVTIDTPDEGMAVSITLSTSDCSMTPI